MTVKTGQTVNLCALVRVNKLNALQIVQSNINGWLQHVINDRSFGMSMNCLRRAVLLSVDRLARKQSSHETSV